MKEERLSISSQQLDVYLAQAKQLRNQEISRLSRQLFRLPQQLFQRLIQRLKQGLSNKTDQTIVN